MTGRTQRQYRRRAHYPARINFGVTAELRAALETLADKADTCVAEVARDCIEAGIGAVRARTAPVTSRPGRALSEQDEKIAVARLMAGAQAHQRASVYCMDKPDAKPPNIDRFYFNVVSFELILMSVEQSLRLLLLLHYGIIRADTGHVPHVLYKAILRESGGKSGIRRDIVATANALGRAQGLPATDEKEILACLHKHDSSYANFRHFQLNKQGGLNPDLGLKPREIQVVHCLALALIQLNMDEITKRKLQVLSMSAVPESEMTADIRVLKERMLER